MDPFIDTYHEAYAYDLEMHLGLENDKLPPALAVSTLLNPLLD
jgi:hypothetical protein